MSCSRKIFQKSEQSQKSGRFLIVANVWELIIIIILIGQLIERSNIAEVITSALNKRNLKNL